MKFVVWFLFLLLLAVYACFRPHKMPDETGKVLRQPKIMLHTSIAGCILFAGFATYMVFLGMFSSITGIILSWVIMFVLLCMSYGMLLSYLNWRFKLFEHSFAYSTFLGRRYEYRYEEIACYKNVADGIAVRMKDGKSIHFEHINVAAYYTLMLFASRSLGGRDKFGEYKPRFFGTEMRGKRFLTGIILLIMCGTFLVGGILAILFIDTGAPYNEANIETTSVRYESGTVKGSNTKNASLDAKGTVYQVRGFAYDVFAQDDFLDDIKKDDILYLTVPKDQYVAGKSPLDVIHIQEVVWCYLSMEDVNQRYVENGVLGKWLGIIIAPISLITMLFIVYLLKNPQRLLKGQKMFFGNTDR